MITELQRQITEETAKNGAPMEQISRNAVRGTLNELVDPARQADIQQVARATTDGVLSSMGIAGAKGAWGGGPAADPIAVAGDRFSMGFTLGLSRQLQVELGSGGDGPLGRSFSGLAREVSASAASGVVAKLPADLSAGTPSQLDTRVYDLSRSAAAGFADGIAAAVRLPLMAASFAAGLLSAAVLVFFTRRRSRRREDRS